MNILKTPDYRPAVTAEAAGVNRYRRQTTPRNEYIRSSAGESSASNSGARQVSLGSVLSTPPTSLLSERRATVNRTTQNSRSSGIDAYRRINDYFDSDTAKTKPLQLQQSSQIKTPTSSSLRPAAVIKAYQASTTSTLLSATLSGSSDQTGILGGSGSSILSNVSPAGVMQQGIQQYQLMDSSSKSLPASLSRGADLYLKTGTKLVNESGLFA